MRNNRPSPHINDEFARKLACLQAEVCIRARLRARVRSPTNPVAILDELVEDVGRVTKILSLICYYITRPIWRPDLPYTNYRLQAGYMQTKTRFFFSLLKWGQGRLKFFICFDRDCRYSCTVKLRHRLDRTVLTINFCGMMCHSKLHW